MRVTILSLALCTALCAAAAQAGDTLLVERVQAEAGAALPARGASMADVEARFGAPERKYPAVGASSTGNNPPITRWAYPTFSVYFEHDHVVDAVVNKSSPTEVGPMPVQP